MIDLGSPRSSFEIFAALASNDLFMRRWVALCEDPTVATLADETLDAEDEWYDCREALQRSIREGIEDLQRLAEATVPGVFTAATMRQLHELCYDAHLGLRRQAREQAKIRVTLVVDPDDGQALDEEHLAVVRDETGDEPLDSDGWRRLRDRLAACKRPARVWTSDRAIQVEWDAPGDDEPTVNEREPIPMPPVPPPPIPPAFAQQFARAVHGAVENLNARAASDPAWISAAAQDLGMLTEFFLPPLVEGLRSGGLTLAAFDEGVASFEDNLRSLFAALRAGLEEAA